MKKRARSVTPERAALERDILASYGIQSQRQIAARLGVGSGVVAKVSLNAIKAGLLKPMGSDGWRRMHALGRNFVRGPRAVGAEPREASR